MSKLALSHGLALGRDGKALAGSEWQMRAWEMFMVEDVAGDCSSAQGAFGLKEGLSVSLSFQELSVR